MPDDPGPIQRPIIVTACDEAYVGLLTGLLQSLEQHQTLAHLPIGLIDLGLAPATREALQASGVHVVEGRWDFDFPARETWEQNHRGSMGMIAKAFLPDYFPVHDGFLWIDADVWVQLPDGVTAFLDALRDSPAAAVLELDRSYHKYLRKPGIWNFHNGLVQDNYGAGVAKRMRMRPLINAGVYAMRAEAPHWALWHDGMTRALKRQQAPFDDHRLFDQVALNVAVHLGELPTAFLPALYNWSLLEARPLWCPRRRLYVEPSPPHDPIRNLHLTGPSKTDRFNIKVLGSEATFETALIYASARRNAPTSNPSPASD